MSPLGLADAPTWSERQALMLSVSDPAEINLARVLRDVRKGGYDLGEVPEALLAPLAGFAAQDPNVLDFALEVLTSRLIPTDDERPAQQLSLVQEQVCLELFARTSPARGSAAIDGFWAAARAAAREASGDPFATPNDEVVAAVMLATSAVGRPQDLSFVLSIAPEEPRVGGPFERALMRMLRANTDTFGRLQNHALRLTEGQVARALSAVAAVDDPRALHFVDDLLRWDDAYERQAAGVIASLGRSLDDDLNDSLARFMVDLLERGEPQLVRPASQALETLRCELALEPLVAALEDEEEPHARAAIVRALRATADASLPPEPKVWRLWLRDARAWQAGVAPAQVARLTHHDPVQVIDATRELTRYHVGRRAHAAELMELLDATDDAVRAAACSALAQLDVPGAVPALIEALENGAPGESLVNVEAAIVRLTGWPLQPDAEAWRALFVLEAGSFD